MQLRRPNSEARAESGHNSPATSTRRAGRGARARRSHPGGGLRRDRRVELRVRCWARFLRCLMKRLRIDEHARRAFTAPQRGDGRGPSARATSSDGGARRGEHGRDTDVIAACTSYSHGALYKLGGRPPAGRGVRPDAARGDRGPRPPRSCSVRQFNAQEGTHETVAPAIPGRRDRRVHGPAKPANAAGRVRLVSRINSCGASGPSTPGSPSRI